ncbi:hypothetical protein FISHEDRAFT_41136 [Fistulina hepatica ATCC 64428]|nr:hypothetical protein FISHEDRAFT_41136 [Fistulina hepatica ATCC 64428]
MSSTPREIGTLIVVVLKANHLPNKRQFGKQDPYCVVEVNGEKRRTKAIKRGGQHPEWDEEIRFIIYEDLDDELARTANGDGTPPPLPPKNSHAPKKIQGGKTMQLMCFADDPREPDLIGEGQVDLTEVLTKGETDEWFTLMHKGKFAGKVYLELTFWSNVRDALSVIQTLFKCDQEPPPEKKTKKVAKNGLYGGTGDFTAGVELPESTGHRSHQGRAASLYEQPRRGESISTPSMRSSSSMHQMELYRPSYEQRNSPNVFDQLSNDFAQLNTFHDRRRDSFPVSLSCHAISSLSPW